MALLIDRGADLRASDEDNRTALHFAAAIFEETAIALLLDCGADLTATDNFGKTAPMLCVCKRVAQTIDSFVSSVSDEWRPSRHLVYPRPFRGAVATVVALWSWNSTTNAPWHPDSPFTLLSLELLFEVFIWLAADIARCGYADVAPVPARESARKKKRGREVDDGLCLNQRKAKTARTKK